MHGHISLQESRKAPGALVSEKFHAPFDSAWRAMAPRLLWDRTVGESVGQLPRSRCRPGVGGGGQSRRLRGRGMGVTPVAVPSCRGGRGLAPVSRRAAFGRPRATGGGTRLLWVAAGCGASHRRGRVAPARSGGEGAPAGRHGLSNGNGGCSAPDWPTVCSASCSSGFWGPCAVTIAVPATVLL